jgi:magnesium transporter
MAKGRQKTIPVKTNGSNGIILALEERGFCVYHKKNGKIVREQSRNVEALAKMAQDASLAWVDYLIEDMASDLPKVAGAFGFSDNLAKALLKETRSGYEDFEDEMGIMFPAITVTGFDVKLNPLVILMKKNLILTLHTTEVKRFFRLRRYAETMMRKLPQKALPADRLTLLLVRILDESNTRNFDHLREIEEHGDKLSAQLADTRTPRDVVGPQIYLMKHALVTYLSGLWATVDALNSLRYGDAKLITNDQHIINKMTWLITEVHSHIGLAEHMSDVLASGLEVLQSIYNNQLQILNNRLALLVAYLTIIGTALLVPNTIATVAGNSMFKWGVQDEGWYLTLIVVSTIVATLISWLVVKKMGLLPKSPDAD